MRAYALASASGLTFAFFFFLVLSAIIGIAIFALLTRPSARKRELGLATVQKPVAATVALLAWLVVFASIHVSSLAGFHRLTIDRDGIRLDYVVPPRSLFVRYDDIGDVRRRPAFRQQWYLEIYTLTGARFQSATGSYAAIEAAAEDLSRRRGRD